LVTALAHRASVKPFVPGLLAGITAVVVIASIAAIAGVGASASAQDEAATLGTSQNGLRGLARTGSPLAPTELGLSAYAGYGATGSVAPATGSHPRALGSLAAALTPRPWLGFALRLDGRLDFHEDTQNDRYSGAVGDPRLLARVGKSLTRALSIGAELGLWFPGRQAPSFEPRATSADLSGLFALAPRGGRWSLLASAGYRLDNSAHTAPDLARLRPGDRLALGLSDFDALLVGLGAAYRVGLRGEAFVEFAGDFLVGENAPRWRKSPLRAALGGRYFFSPRLQAELTATMSLSDRPAIGASDPLIPIDPRFSLLAGLRYAFRLTGEPQPEPIVQHEPTPRAPEFVELSGVLVDDTGQALPESRVSLRPADGTDRSAITDAEGRYRFMEVPLGPARLQATATGYAPFTWEVDVVPSLPPQSHTLGKSAGTTGVIRGLVRSFGSEPLIAQVQIRRAVGGALTTLATDAEGRFEIELSPGDYRVMISANGYRAHRRDVIVESEVVAILNVDMREQ
jgi:hypothetical protein